MGVVVDAAAGRMLSKIGGFTHMHGHGHGLCKSDIFHLYIQQVLN